MSVASGSGLIFDLDGTLADTLDDITAALNHTLAIDGYDPLDKARVRRLVGSGLSNLIESAANCPPTEVDRLVHLFREHYALHALDRTVLYSGWTETLDALQRLNVPMAVLSNKPDTYTKQMCAALLADWTFVAFAGETPDKPLKPDPSRALELCAAMNLEPSNVYFVGDSVIDIETARRAGMKSIAATWGFRDRGELVAAGPDRLIGHPRELLELTTFREASSGC